MYNISRIYAAWTLDRLLFPHLNEYDYKKGIQCPDFFWQKEITKKRGERKGILETIV